MSWLRDWEFNFELPALAEFQGWNKDKVTPEVKLVVKDHYKFEIERQKILIRTLHADTWIRLVYDVMNAVQKRIKPEQKLILTGRDCFPLYVVAKKRAAFKHRTVFIPEISRGVSNSRLALTTLIKKKGLRFTDFYVDTGYSGSIFAVMRQVFQEEGRKTNPDFNCTGMYSNNFQRGDFWLASSSSTQMYPCLLIRNDSLYRQWIEEWEHSPKYWETASAGYRSKQVRQDAVDSVIEFLKACALTRILWDGSTGRYKAAELKGPFPRISQ